jgi:hemolysin-activating ACP:hemolysin acyltransferase
MFSRFRKSRDEGAKQPAARPGGGAVAKSPARPNGELGRDAKPGTAQALPPDDLKKRAAAAKLSVAAFGEIVSLLMRSPHCRQCTLQDLEWLVIPAVQSGQFTVAQVQSKRSGGVAPVAAVLWAMVSPDVDLRLKSKPRQPMRLEAKEWKSGQIPWIVEAVGDGKVLEQLLRQLQGTVFKDKQVNILIKDAKNQVSAGKLSLKPSK